jgi:hypothetical protein
MGVTSIRDAVGVDAVRRRITGLALAGSECRLRLSARSDCEANKSPSRETNRGAAMARGRRQLRWRKLVTIVPSCAWLPALALILATDAVKVSSHR